MKPVDKDANERVTMANPHLADGPLVVALCLPVLYEVWRMAYFAMIVANTALAKSAGASWWSQGFTYLWNFVSPYTLWLPFLLAVPLAVPRIRRWWSTRDRIGVVVLLTPAVAGMADMLYVVHVGGDYMHARLLLPAFLSFCLALYVDMAQLRSLVVIAVAGIVIWTLVCAGWLRGPQAGSFADINRIDNERSVSIDVTGNPHPITVADWGDNPTMVRYRKIAAMAAHQGRQLMFVGTYPWLAALWDPQDIRAARSPLPFALAVDLTNIGVDGYTAGPSVYVFDALSLANPIGSHTPLLVHGRPGGDKIIGPSWMIARFGVPGEPFPEGTASSQSIAAATKSLDCQPLSSYLKAITAPLTFSQALSNVMHSLTYTTMSFSSNPIQAEQKLCR
jgi:arabinofuranosyltransferase